VFFFAVWFFWLSCNARFLHVVQLSVVYLGFVGDVLIVVFFICVCQSVGWKLEDVCIVLSGML